MGFWRKSRDGSGQSASNEAAATVAPRRSLYRRLPWKYRALLALTIVCAAVGGSVISAALIHYTIKFPDPMSLRRESSTPTVRVLARDGSVISERGQSHEFVPLDLLPRHVIDAVVATEDRRFFEHVGLDFFGMLRATFANIRAGRYVQGGSTLSQQLAKNLFLSAERTLGRKVEELLLAIWLEVRLSKADILELYLNRVYFGGGAYGIEAASRRYFDKPAAQLKVSEAAVLAGLLKAPSKYAPSSSPGLARSRARLVLKKMLAAGYIGDEAEAAAARESVRFADPAAGRDITGLEYAVDFVLERLPPLVGSNHREIIVETTIDAALQKRAQAAVAATLSNEGAKASAGQAAVVVVDRDGGIRTMIGGRSWVQSQYNRAVKAKRQPGSAFKPLVYLTAVERGALPEQTVVDAPITIGDWSPRNEDNRHRGSMSLRQALAHSVNTVAVRLQQDVGTNRVVALARRLGIKSELRPDLSLALGTSEVSLLELTGAYAVLASGGMAVTPHMIRKVRTASTVLYQRPEAQPRIVVAPHHVGIMSSMLNAAMVSGTGRRAALVRHVAAGKTGTSQDYRDAWFVGYTAHLTAAVWVGNDNGDPMSRVMGGGLPASIWKSIMQPAHDQLPPALLPGMEADQPQSAAPSPAETPATRMLRSESIAPRQQQGQLSLPGIPRREPMDARDGGADPATRSAPSERAAQSSPPRRPLSPQQSIDSAIILQALGEPIPAEQPRTSQLLDFGQLARSLEQWTQPRAMGLGVKPPPAQPEGSSQSR